MPIIDGKVGSDPGIDIVDVDVLLTSKIPTGLLVRGILLVGPAGVTVEGEEGL
jgi:hypothetical protein